MFSLFIKPLLVLAGVGAYFVFLQIHQEVFAEVAILFAVFLGSYQLVVDTARSLFKKRFALDYIAILAIAVSLFTKEFLVAAIIAFMLTSGRTLEAYGVSQAKQSLAKLIERIPDKVTLVRGGVQAEQVRMADVKVGDQIFIRKGEVIALDGALVSENALADESSLTGEFFPVEKIAGDVMRSGTLNIGEAIVVRVEKAEKDSAYRKILAMVQKAQQEKSPFVRLADKYSAFFTILTLAIAAFAYAVSGQLERVLAVLVIATPCPLILATPIALLGGMNASAKKRIIIKKLASLEVLSRVQAMIFDKTGTITLGKPVVVGFEPAPGADAQHVLAVSEALERNSLHPIAKAIATFAKERQVPMVHAQNVQERIGSGIAGQVAGKSYALSRVPDSSGIDIAVVSEGAQLGIFHIKEEIKKDSKEVIQKLKKSGMSLFLFTGDKKESALRVAKELGEGIEVRAEMKPEDKEQGVALLKKQGNITAMVGDGINDAPALALANVGMVFSNEEQSAASDAADVVFLAGDLAMVSEARSIAKRTVRIALQSIGWGIGLSIGGMVLASFGFIVPVAGAIFQEAIDVAVILNALRACKS